MERQITLGDVIAPAKVLRCDNDDYPVLSMTMHDGIVLQSNRFKKSLVSIDQSNYKVVLRGQLVVGFPIDEGVIYVQNIAEAGIMSPVYGVWNIHSKEILPEYLELCLHSPQSMDYYKNKLRGTTARRRSITTGDLLALPIILPSLTEQKRRIGLFRQTTLLLNSQKQTMLKFDELVKSRFVEMFGEPATNPMGWMETTVGRECYSIKDGPHVSLPDIGRENGGHPFISVRNIVNHVIDFSTARYISDEDFAIARKKCCPQKGDMLYSKGGTTGIAKLIDVDVEFANWVHLAVLKYDKGKLNGVFFENMLNCDYCYGQSQKLTKGIANRDLVLSAIAQIKIYRPPVELQKRFAAFIAEVDKSKLAVKQSLEELETLKKSLMQQYFG